MDLPLITFLVWGKEHEPERTAIIIFNRTVRKSSVHCFSQSNDFAETKCFTQSLNALLCSPCGFVSPKQLVVQSQYHLAGRRYGCLYPFSYHCAPIYIIYIAQQGCSTSIHSDTPPFLEQCQKTEQRKNKEAQFVKHRPDVVKGICWSLRAISSFI